MTVRPGEDDTATDAELVTAVRGGDASAPARLVRRYLRKAMATAVEFMPTREDAEDVVQDALQAAFRNLDRFDERRAFGPWLLTIVRNTARNALAARQRRPTVAITGAEPATDASPLELTHRRALGTAIDAALGELSDMQRRCFQLCVVEGLSNVEAAYALDLAEATVRVHVFRARQRLQPLLARWRDDLEDA